MRKFKHVQLTVDTKWVGLSLSGKRMRLLSGGLEEGGRGIHFPSKCRIHFLQAPF